ncbi:MAG: hypothetical protein AABW59_02225 [archaeon]
MQRRKPKPTLLFVDDLQSVHNYTSKVSRQIGAKKRTAFNPAQAEKIISQRLAAIQRLRIRLEGQASSSKNPKERKVLIGKINYLKQLKTKPFDLIISDVNMPHGFPVGVKFAEGVKKRYPGQKILMHSDDQHALDYLREKGIDYEVKRNQHDNEAQLKQRLKQELWPKKFKRKQTDDDWY